MVRRSIPNELKRSVADCAPVGVPTQSALDTADYEVSSTISELLTPRECAEYPRCSVRTLDRERAELRGPP
jgi:hypothetical protein